MATISEDTGRWLPQKMDVKKFAITVGRTTRISVHSIVGSPLRFGACTKIDQYKNKSKLSYVKKQRTSEKHCYIDAILLINVLNSHA